MTTSQKKKNLPPATVVSRRLGVEQCDIVSREEWATLSALVSNLAVNKASDRRTNLPVSW